MLWLLGCTSQVSSASATSGGALVDSLVPMFKKQIRRLVKPDRMCPTNGDSFPAYTVASLQYVPANAISRSPTLSACCDEWPAIRARV